METYLNDNILKASNLKSPQTCADNVVSDSSPMSPIPTVGQSLLQTVTENETDRLSSGVLGVGHKSFHSAMRATSFHFPENCSLAKKYWWFSLEQFISQRQLKTICTNDAKYHTFEHLWGWEAKKLRQQESFEQNKVSTYLIWEQNAYALRTSCISLQYLFLLWKQFNSPKAVLQVLLCAELALQKRSERAENRREKGSKVCSCNQPRQFCPRAMARNPVLWQQCCPCQRGPQVKWCPVLLRDIILAVATEHALLCL